jgi:ribosomal protein S18 acetylase RimI-like enzyme
MQIRRATPADHPAIWRILEPVLRAGETYALPREMTEPEALAYWTGPDRETFVAESGGTILGTYYIRPNQSGGGSHVANCGYITAQQSTGQGIARQMGEHSLHHARTRGFKAMQFNLVISTNTRAITLWQTLGFKTLATLPAAFNHPKHGYIDALLMYQTL